VNLRRDWAKEALPERGREFPGSTTTQPVPGQGEPLPHRHPSPIHSPRLSSDDLEG